MTMMTPYKECTQIFISLQTAATHGNYRSKTCYFSKNVHNSAESEMISKFWRKPTFVICQNIYWILFRYCQGFFLVSICFDLILVYM